MPTNSEQLGLPESVLRDIAAKGVIKQFPARTVLIHEGDVSTSLFIVLAGTVKAYATNEDGKKVTLGIFAKGEYVGELALDGGARDASVITMESTTCAIVDGALLRDFIGAHPEVALHLIHDLIKRVRGLSHAVKSLALEDTYRRVASLLRRLAESEGMVPVVKTRLTHLEIAEVVGSSREMISRILKDLKVGGYIEVRSGRIALLKKLPKAW